MMNLINCRINVFIRTDRAELIFISDQDIGLAVYLLDDLSREIASVRRGTYRAVSFCADGIVRLCAQRLNSRFFAHNRLRLFGHVRIKLHRHHIIVRAAVGQRNLVVFISADRCARTKGFCLCVA